MLREIRLYGELGRRFGRVHYLAVSSVGEAMRALMANYKDFEKAVIDHKPGYKIWAGTSRVGDVAEIHNPTGSSEVIRIAPVVAGAKSQGMGQIIIGALLIAAAVIGNYFFPGNPVSPYLMNAGVAMIIGGTIQLLSPMPKQDAGSGDKNSPSYVFNGTVNTEAQGHPVPVGYGRLIVGSAVISAGISNTDIPV